MPTELMDHYAGTVLAWLITGLMLFVQLTVADLVGARAKKTPGMAVEGGHDDFLFRAHRAFENTRESVGIFILVTLACVGVGAAPVWTSALALAWVATRLGHMLCYWLDWRLVRSIFFGVSMLPLAALAILALVAY